MFKCTPLPNPPHKGEGKGEMFIWDYSAIFAVVIIVTLGVVFMAWVFYTCNRKLIFEEQALWEEFRQCHYCAYVYIDHLKRAPCRCPRCLSYHDAA
ncbi:MAG: hypothetical protein HY591_04575 [Candidatus Omnitrophica bacterium]|nr:hypothetical protein [Candidatus Omnitrophota bacterium]